jgi:hypothetical protein
MIFARAVEKLCSFVAMNRKLLTAISCIVLLTIQACKKDSFITSGDARLFTSADTLKFDTVFTTTGSVTQSFKIINDNNQRLRLDRVKLMGGTASAYKLNIDGTAAPEVTNIEIAANDSIYVFVSVTINPSAANLPFIVSDSILINYNGRSRYVQLQAFGQNANFLRNQVITGNVTWSNTKPYVILGSLRIDTTARLTIPAGTRIYAHADAPLLVDGTLITSGAKNNEVVFAGDRLDPDYKDLPAGWPGIYFRGTSKDNVLNYTVVKNAYQAVVVDKPSINISPKLKMSQCIIDNAYDAGLLCINTRIVAENSLVSNCGSNVALLYGGNYVLTHCTVATYSNNYITHKNPVLLANNFLVQGATTLTSNMSATFTNCIFWGDFGLVDNEVSVSKQGANSFTVAFNNCLYKAQTDPASATFTNSVKNLNPSFDSVDVSRRYYDFRISNPAAPGINKGIATGLLRDLDNKNRSVGLPDMGAYERQ